MFSSWEVYFARKLHSRLSRRFKQKQLPNVRDISWKIVNFLFFYYTWLRFLRTGFPVINQPHTHSAATQVNIGVTQVNTGVTFLYIHSCSLVVHPFILVTLVVDPFHSCHTCCWSLSFFSQKVLIPFILFMSQLVLIPFILFTVSVDPFTSFHS